MRPGIPSNWRTFESNSLDIESQFDTVEVKDSNRIFYFKSFVVFNNLTSISSYFDSNII